MAVVKADGFGHGAAAVARTALAHGASWLGVTSLDEALALRAAGLTAPVLSWLNPVDADFTAAIGARVDVAVPSLRAPRGRAAAPASAPACTCTSTPAWPATAPRPRSGRRCAAPPAAAERDGRLRVVGVMGHLGCADVPARPGQRGRADRLLVGPRRRPRRRPAPAAAPPRGDRRHPDRPGVATTR